MGQLLPAQLRVLIQAARGLRPCDLVLRGGFVVNLFTGETIQADVGLVGRRIAVVNNGRIEAENEIDATDLLLAPGFIDSHMHLESSLLVPAEFARAVLPHGTTSVVIDPHEIANVSGSHGIRELMRASDGLPVTFYFTIPPAVPASDLDMGAARLDASDMAALADELRVVGVAEAMDYVGVLEASEEVLDKLTALPDGVVDGHAPGLGGRELQAYAAAGISSDHETTNQWEGMEKLRAGLYLMIREGSAAHNLDVLARLVNPNTIERCLLATDDLLPTDIEDHGHIDHLLRKMVRNGIAPVQALRMATINPAHRFRLDRVGAIAPGYAADIVGLDDLSSFHPSLVVAKGEPAVLDGELIARIDGYTFDPALTRSVHLSEIDVEDLTIPAREGDALVIGTVANQIITRRLLLSPATLAGRVVADTDHDILKVIVVERHGKSGDIGLGLVRGFGLKAGAIAGSVAHDSHNVIAVGVADADMLLAIKRVGEMSGGLVVAAGGRVLHELPLPIGGLMSTSSAPSVAHDLRRLNESARHLGCTMADPFATLSFLCLSVVPELKITARGLVDVEQQRIVPLYLGEQAEAAA